MDPNLLHLNLLIRRVDCLALSARSTGNVDSAYIKLMDHSGT